MTLRRWIRIGLVFEALGAAYVGLWALPVPKSFHDNFPGLGMNWPVASGPYNEHYVRDVGAMYVAFALLFAWAALRTSRALVVPVAVAWAVVQGFHLVFHLAHDEGLTTTEWVMQATSLAGFLVVAVALAVAGRRLRQ